MDHDHAHTLRRISDLENDIHHLLSEMLAEAETLPNNEDTDTIIEVGDMLNKMVNMLTLKNKQ